MGNNRREQERLFEQAENLGRQLVGIIRTLRGIGFSRQSIINFVFGLILALLNAIDDDESS